LFFCVLNTAQEMTQKAVQNAKLVRHEVHIS
jgi:hypothetical protein